MKTSTSCVMAALLSAFAVGAPVEVDPNVFNNAALTKTTSSDGIVVYEKPDGTHITMRPRPVTVTKDVNAPESTATPQVKSKAEYSFEDDSTKIVDLENDIEKRQNPGFIQCTGHSGVASLAEDCQQLIGQIAGSSQTLVVDGMNCLEQTYGSCLAYICATCDDLTVNTVVWAQGLQGVYSQCVIDEGEYGQKSDVNPPPATYELGLESSGHVLPVYTGDNCAGDFPAVTLDKAYGVYDGTVGGYMPFPVSY